MIAALTTTNGIARINCDVPVALEVADLKVYISLNKENGNTTISVNRNVSDQHNQSKDVTTWRELFRDDG